MPILLLQEIIIGRKINKRGFVARGGGLIGVGVALTATLVSAAVENAASDVDTVPAFETDLAAEVQARLAERIVEATGARLLPNDAITDTGRSMSFLKSGKEQLLADAKSRGFEGKILDVRATFTGIQSSGIRSDGDETFKYVAQMDAGIVDSKTGNIDARSKCIATVPGGILLKIKADQKKAEEAYFAAVDAVGESTEVDVQGTDEHPTPETELPPRTYNGDENVENWYMYRPWHPAADSLLLVLVPPPEVSVERLIHVQVSIECFVIHDECQACQEQQVWTSAHS